MTCLWNQPCLLYLLLTYCCGQCLDRLEPLDYDLDEDTQNSFQRNEENRKNYFQVSKGHNTSRTMNEQEQLGPLQANESGKLKVRRSCKLPEAAFIFKQVMIPECDFKTFTSVCKEPDMMNLLQFQGRKETFRRPSGFSDYGNLDESIDDTGIIFKEAIGFEIPEDSGSKGKPYQRGNTDSGIDHRAKCRLVHDIRSNRVNVAIQDILTSVQTVEKLKGRGRREIHCSIVRATPKPRWDTFETSLGKTRAIPTDQESRLHKRPNEKPATINRSWQEKLWENIRRSSFAHQKRSPIPSAVPGSSYSWKFLHLKSRSFSTSAPVPKQGEKYSFRRFFKKNHSAESQPRAMHPGHKHWAPTKSNARPHKGHYCHYHYKNHRIREQQAFHRLKANTKQFWRTLGTPDEESSTSQALDDDAIMSTLEMDFSGPTHQDVKPPTPKTCKTTMFTSPVWTSFEHVQTTVVKTTVTSQAFASTATPQTFAATVPPCKRTTDTPTTDESPTTSTTTEQTETTTQLTTYLTTINTNFITEDKFTTGVTAKEVDVKDDESATADIPSEVGTIINYVHRKRFRKT